MSITTKAYSARSSSIEVAESIVMTKSNVIGERCYKGLYS